MRDAAGQKPYRESGLGNTMSFETEELRKLPEDKIEASIGAGSAALGAGIGASDADAVAAGSVTVLGSHAFRGRRCFC